VKKFEGCEYFLKALDKYGLSEDERTNHFKGAAEVVVAYHTQMETNLSISKIVSLPEMRAGEHSLEERDQLLLLHAVDIMDKDPTTKLDVFSVDTEMFAIVASRVFFTPTWTDGQTSPLETYSRDSEINARVGKQLSDVPEWHKYTDTSKLN